MDEKTTYELSGAEKIKYKAWLLDAYEAARDFDGSETHDSALYKPLEHIDDFVQERNDGKTSTELEQAFAEACSPELPDDAPKTVNALLSLAGQFYDRASKASTQADLLDTLSNGGALVIPSSAIFVQTDEGSILPAKSDNPKHFEMRRQPRLATLVRRLKEAGIFTDDLIIRVGSTDPNMVRSKPYILVQIPRLDKEVAVCDLVGEITFVSNRILGPAVWEHLSKDELKARGEIRAIQFNSEDQWWNDIAGTLLGNEPEQRKKVKLSTFSKKKEPLHIELIVQAAKIHHERTEKWPSGNSGEILGDPLKGNTWAAIDSAIRGRLRGLDQTGLPDRVISLATLLEWQGISVSRLSKTRKLTVKDIIAAAKAHHARAGKWPTAYSGEILDGLLKGEKWANIDAAIYCRGRGLEKADLPNEVKTIGSLLEWQRLTITHISKAKTLHVDDIASAAKAHFERTGKWPSRESGAIFNGPIKGTTWSAVHSAIQKRGRGLDQADLPGWVNGIPSFLEWKKLSVAKNSEIRHLDVDDILTAVKSYHAKRGEWPTNTTKDLIEEPPKLKGDTWGALSLAINRRYRGLKKADLPGHVEGIASFLEWQSLTISQRSKERILDVECIVLAAKAHHVRTGNWPTQDSGEIIDEPLKGNTWSSISIAIRLRGRGLSKANLPDSVKGLGSFLWWQNLKITRNTQIISVDDIFTAAKAHHTRTGKWPTQRSGEIIEEPLKGKTWSGINSSIQRRCLDRTSLPDHVKGIVSLLKWQGSKKDSSNKFEAENVSPTGP